MANLRELIRERGQEVLAAFERQLLALDIELPERRYVGPGSLPVWDGEQLVVNLMQLQQGKPGQPQTTGVRPPQLRVFAAQWAVTLVRSVPALEVDGPVAESIPDAPELEEAGLQTLEDAGALALAAQQIHEGSELTRPGHDFAIDVVRPLGPEGGLAANQIVITLSLS